MVGPVPFIILPAISISVMEIDYAQVNFDSVLTIVEHQAVISAARYRDRGLSQ